MNIFGVGVNGERFLIGSEDVIIITCGEGEFEIDSYPAINSLHIYTAGSMAIRPEEENSIYVEEKQ